MNFRFYQLVRTSNGYVMRPHVTLYDGMIEILRFGSPMRGRGASESRTWPEEVAP